MARQRNPKPSRTRAVRIPLPMDNLEKAANVQFETPSMFRDVFANKKNAPVKIERDPEGPYGLSSNTIKSLRTIARDRSDRTGMIRLSVFEEEIADLLDPLIVKHGVLSAADAWEILQRMDHGGRVLPDKSIFNRIRAQRGWYSHKVGKGWIWVLPLP